MKKKIILIISIIALLFIFSILCLKFIPFGVKNYTLSNSITLELPKISFLKEESENNVSFKTIRGKSIVIKELENTLDKYEKITCNNETFLYSKEKDVTITDYGINSGFIINTYYINYHKGLFDNNKCSVITDPTKLKYQIRSAELNYENRCSIPDQFKYANNNGNTYNVYYECFGDLLFKTGLEEMNFLNNMLSYGWISMHDIIDFLEFQVKNNEAAKESFWDNGATIYKNKDFTLLKCNTLDGNQDIYIGDTNLEYTDSFCK